MEGMKFTGWGRPDKTFDLDGKPALRDFIRRVAGLTDFAPHAPPDFASIDLAEPRIEAGFLAAVRSLLGESRVLSDRETRLRHGYGKSYRDLLRAMSGRVGRTPDLVLFPESTAEVEGIIAAAATHRVKLIPFGGGTNIVGGVEVSPQLEEMVATVSLRRMNRVLSIDRVSQVARIETGILGPELEEALNRVGFSLGHFPDSFEHSTLGGWIATRSAGMQSDRWGKIEDMVVSLTLVSPAGTLRTPAIPKASTGPDWNHLLAGSEGVLGILTEATMRIHPLQEREHRGILLPDFERGVHLLRTCAQSGPLPSTMRLSCPEETQLGIAMKPRPTAFKAKLQTLGAAWIRATKGIELREACSMIVGFEGSRREIAAKRRAFGSLVKSLGGVDLGTSAGDRWFAGKYDYPYLRDAIMLRGGMVDVVETSAPWSHVLAIYQDVKHALHGHLRRDGCEGYAACHISHSYRDGACLYFTFAARQQKGRELEQYLATKGLIVDLLLASGAALSHHHAIGYEHLPWMREALGDTAIVGLTAIKRALDPENLCNPGKLIPGEDLFSSFFPPLPAGPPS